MTKNSSIIEKVEAIVKIASEHQIDEIKLKEDNLEIKIIRTKNSNMNVSSSVPLAHIQQPVNQMPLQDNTNNTMNVVADDSKHPGAVISPMIGIVYRAPDTNSKNYVEVGSSVKKGDTLMLIEAMKVFNPIQAHVDGVVTKILVSSETPVEFGEVLLIIE